MAIVEEPSGAIIITGPHIEFYRLCVLRSALKLQIQGITVNRRINAASAVRTLLNTNERSKEVLLTMLTAKIDAWKP
jgi:hypothetical protein